MFSGEILYLALSITKPYCEKVFVIGKVHVVRWLSLWEETSSCSIHSEITVHKDTLIMRYLIANEAAV